jgi:hypothetical protein
MHHSALVGSWHEGSYSSAGLMHVFDEDDVNTVIDGAIELPIFLLSQNAGRHQPSPYD